MDQLAKYIADYYPHLMTLKEKAAYKASFAEEKAENLQPGNLQRMLRERWGPTDPEVLALMKDGREEFLKGVSERVVLQIMIRGARRLRVPFD